MVRVKGVMTHIPANQLTDAQRKQVKVAHMHRQLGRGPSVKERRVEREVGETLRLTRHHIDRGRTAGIFQGGDITRTRKVKGGTVHIADDAFDLNMAPHAASGGFSTASLKPGQSQRQADRAVSITRGTDTKGIEAHEVEGHANRRKKLSWEVRSAMHPEKLLGDEARADSKMSLARRKLSRYNVAANANNPAMLGTENPDYRRAGRKGLQRYREVSRQIDDAKPKSTPVRAYNAFTQAQPMRSALDFRNRVAEQAQRPARSLINRFLPERSHQYSKADVVKAGLLRPKPVNYTRAIGALLRTPRPRSGGIRRNAYGTISTFRGSVR
jgi:hypothetical protein